MFEYKEDCKAYEKNVHHSKVMVIKNKDEEIGDGTAIYMGSHNMSGGAWGVLQRQGPQRGGAGPRATGRHQPR